MQLAYTIEHLPGYEGDLAMSGPRRVIALRNNTASDLPYGRAVVHDAGTGTSDMAAKLPAASTDVVLGVTINSRSTAPLMDGSGVDGIKSGDAFNCLSQGCVYVMPEQDVAVGEPVYVRFATGSGGSALGSFRKDADTATAGVLANARWVAGTTVTSGRPAILEINLPK